MENFPEHIIEKILSKIYYQYLPEKIKKFLSPSRLAFKFLILPRIYHLYLSMYLLHGKEKQRGLDLNILLIGDKDALLSISSILYSGDPIVENIGSTFIWGAKKNISRFSKSTDAVFIKTDRFFSRFLQKDGFIIIPEWAYMWLDISAPLEDIYKNFKKSAKEDIRLIKKHQYSYEMSKDTKKLEFFYNELCVPFICKRYKELALPEGTNYQDIKSVFDDGKLLLVKDKDKYVSGMVFKIKNNSVFAVYIGVSTEQQYLTKGAGSAAYYFLINWAKENGFKYLGFGDARAFLNDGVFRYKRKWGMSVKLGKNRSGVFGFKINNFKSKALSDFLESNPFIYCADDALKGLVFVRNTINTDEIKQLHDNYFTPGLTQLSVVCLQELEDEIKNIKNNAKNRNY